MYKYGSENYGGGRKNVITVFVDNLPKEMNKVWLRHIFSDFGKVDDIYIPNKRSAKFNTRFGFFCFCKRDGAVKAVLALNGTFIRNFSFRLTYLNMLVSLKTV